MFKFLKRENTKTKWQPVQLVRGICSNSVFIIYARYDKKTGLYDFKKKKYASNIYTTETPDLKFNTQEILDNMKKDIDQV